MIAYKLLTRDDYEDYLDLVLYFERSLVRDLWDQDRCLAIGAAAGTVKAGLGLVTLPPVKTGLPLLHTVYVLPEYRNQGIGAGLVDRLISAVQRDGWEQMMVKYVLEHDWSPALGRILARRGFEETGRTKIFNIHVGKDHLDRLLIHMQSLLPGKKRQLPPAYRLLPYRDMTLDLRARIEAGRGQWFAGDVDPLANPQRINQEKSIFLLNEEEPVGWLIICDIGPGAVLYRDMAIKPGHRGTGLSLHLLLRGLEWLCDSGKITKALFNTSAENQKMLSLMPKVLEPCVYTVRTSATLLKKLPQPQNCQ